MMRSPDDDFNVMIRVTLLVWMLSLAAAFVFGMFVQSRLS